MATRFHRTIKKRLGLIGMLAGAVLLLVVVSIVIPAWITSPGFWVVEASIGFGMLVLYVADRLDLGYEIATNWVPNEGAGGDV